MHLRMGWLHVGVGTAGTAANSGGMERPAKAVTGRGRRETGRVKICRSSRACRASMSVAGHERAERTISEGRRSSTVSGVGGDGEEGIRTRPDRVGRLRTERGNRVWIAVRQGASTRLQRNRSRESGRGCRGAGAGAGGGSAGGTAVDAGNPAEQASRRGEGGVRRVRVEASSSMAGLGRIRGGG